MQQVNFYSAEFQPQHQHLTLLRLVVVCLMTLAFCIFWLMQQQGQLQQQRQAHQQLQQQVLSLQQQQDSLAIQEASRKPDNSLPSTLEIRQQQLNRLVQVQALLAQLERQNAQGFSPIFKTLAEQSPEGLWLTRILSGSQQLSLEGGVVQPELLGLWVQQLAHSGVFAGQPVSQLEQNKSDDLPGWHFKLSSPLAEVAAP